ncbi:Protein CBR-CPSF-1 [Caenorhabditis briggsae]|uniref:Probable cleavage and polyadenylation specificity factor subunit 1 n=1 Tax=Caenorhabditis briggsae TaxID=6238 RepID=CPSF1_CAEBR|nr:Protein CBR-CPSF-1 [Caenorhabditis briggsae]A8XPU7.1 RecName: Full=Probable cleavage and polyadenylation specificity factor subunit 1; AltName: Full=Cleavage and polyadenylation specificity factor 160 kDa subunit; Short=CPSF 160 kDa subunit [Caenorhabditis briggsae]CAP34673.1 Protein CBR-CPSF-1 [Caenorhabditis briggsae]
MYGYLRETDDSTAINYSAYGKFLPGENTGFQLLTIGAKFLRIFRVNPYVLKEPGEDNEEWQQKTKLECMFSCRLLNKCQSVAVARVPQLPDQDSILMTFDDAKLSIVAVNEKERNMQTISLHAFENEYLRDGFTTYFNPPIVRTDPANRCAASLVYGKHIAILPFHENSKRILSYIIPLKQIDPRLDNVADMVFLEGYYEPTILFLYEPLQTTPGRACVRYDTMCIMGVSVNIVDRQFAVVWQTANLPMDCNSLLSIPKPLGGAVVFGSNTIVYLNQAVPPCGIVLNSCYDGFTKFPLKDMKHLKMTLDCSTSVYMEDGRIAVGSREGDLYLLRLVTSSGGATVKSLEFSKVCDTSIAFTLTVCAPGHLFVGSRLGDSQLLEYTLLKVTKESAKKQRLEQQNPSEIELDEDDIELYGGAIEMQQNDDDEQISESLQFRELDRLLNVGPVKSMCFGRPNYMSNDLIDAKRKDPVFDLVTASGHGKNGALCVHQRSMRPEIITSSLLEGAEQLWAVGRKENESHKYLIVSRVRSTLILELGEELVELEEQLFVTNEPTVAAGELLQGALAVQVTSTCIALVTDGQQMQEVHIDSNFPVVQASIVDPYVAVLTQNGRPLLYELAMEPYVHLREVNVNETSFATFSEQISTQLTSVSIYSDASQIMKKNTVDGRDEKPENAAENGHHVAVPKIKKEIPDDDAMLYGEDDDFLYGDAEEDEPMVAAESGESSTRLQNTRKRKRLGHDAIMSSRGGEQSDAIDPTRTYSSITHWLVVAHDNGRITIHSLPDLELVYQIGRFSNVPELLVDMTVEEEEKEKKAKQTAAQEKEKETEKKKDDAKNEEDQVNSEMKKLCEKVVEAQIVGMGINQAHPVLIAIIDEEVVLYEMFASYNPQPGHLGVAFRKLPHLIGLRTSPYVNIDGKRAPFEMEMEHGKRYTLIHPFERISSINNGVMIGGAVPTLLVYGAWGGMQTHQMTIDGSIKAFTPFNNENVLHGFVYMTQQKSELRIARMHPDFDYDMPYPVKKIEVGKTVHNVRYLMNSDIYAVVSSVPKPSNKIWVVMNDDKQEEIHEKDENFVLPAPPKYTLNLFSSQDWAAVPNTEFEFEDMEAVTAMEDVPLKSESRYGGLDTYLALATVNNYGEEVLVRGRIILCEVIEVVPEPGQPTSNRKIKVLYDKEQKGPVTGLCAINGLLLSGMGQKVFIWQFKDNDLMGISFLDMHYYVYQLHSIRTIALALDARESMSLIRFQEENKAMSIASRDDRKCAQAPMASEFLVDGMHIGFLLSDEHGNITLFSYSPEAPESNGGERLTVKAAINIGTNINAFLRVKGHTSLLDSSSPEERENIEQRMNTIFGSLDGSFGYIRPLTEKSYRRLHFLQTFIGSVTPQIAGLHIKGARSSKPSQPIVNGRNARNLIDGDVVEQYLHLSVYDKTDLARRLGVGRYHILDDLMQLRRMAYYY